MAASVTLRPLYYPKAIQEQQTQGQSTTGRGTAQVISFVVHCAGQSAFAPEAPDATMPAGGHRGFRKPRARASRRSLRKKDLAWTEPQAIHQGRHCEASRMAPRTGPAQHLGSDAPWGVLEVCRAAENRRRKARVVRPERKQFLPAAGTRQAERSRVAGRQEVARARASGLASDGGGSIANAARVEIPETALRRGVSRHLSRRPDTPAPPFDGALDQRASFRSDCTREEMS